jgi:hypothetical protein
MSIEQMPKDHQNLIRQVQHNCDISDANHAGNYTLCIYLLKMREYYRWLSALDYETDLNSEGMGQWLRDKEEIWDQVADQSFKPIELENQQYDPFDHSAINRKIINDRLFYHAGIGQKAAQHFFLAELIEQTLQGQVRISITGREFARDLTSPPAQSTQDEIIVRQESLKRMCWERYQEWNWNRLHNPMGKALSYYDFDKSIPEALEQMVQAEQNTLIQHELGEMAISQELGEQWPAMMLGLLGSKAELLARAVRDNLADSLYTLPFLIKQGNEASLHFYFANLTSLRKQIFPSAVQAYQHWSETSDLSCLSDLAQQSVDHWTKTIHSILAITTGTEQNPAPRIIETIENANL